MTWLDVISSKVNMSQGELRKKLALMLEPACLAINLRLLLTPTK